MREIQDELAGIGQALHLIGKSNIDYQYLTDLLEERIDNILDELDKVTLQKQV